MPQPTPDYHYSELARALTMTPLEARMAILDRKVDVSLRVPGD